MAREFPIPSYMTGSAYPGLTGVTYDYTKSIYECLENSDLELGTYPDGLLWGGISKNDCPYLYPSKMVFNPGSKTLSITRLNGGSEQSATYPDAQIGYMYSICGTFAQSTWPAFLRTTNWRVNLEGIDWNTYKSITLSGFNVPQNFANSYICSETPVNRTCPVVYALAIHKNSYNNLPQQYNPATWWPTGIVQEMCIKDIENGTASYYNQYTNTTYNNLGINDIILVGFRIQEYGVITGFENTDKIHTFGTTNKNKTWIPINNLMGLYAQNVHLASAWKNYSSILIPSKYMVDSNLYANELLSQDLDRAKINYLYSTENHFIGDFGGYRANNTYIPGTIMGAGIGYNGDATIDISDVMDMQEAGGTGFNVYIRPYSAGDKYVFMTAPERLSGYSGQIGYHQLFVYQVFNTLDDLYKYIAGFGMAFTISTRSVNERDIDDGGIYSNDVFAPLLDEHNVYHGEYTRGAANPDNPFFAINSINDSDFEPSDDPEPVPRDENENVGDKITRPATLGAGGTLGFITQYALRAADVTELGGLLWTSIFTTDYWKNYMFSLALDTGSFDLASILNFFISLRVYPFPLLNVPSYATFGNDMYIGTGIMPLHFANNLHTINNYCDYVPGGSARVWSSNFYGDWRDYTNTEIILFIPYCGTVQLNPGDVVGNTVSVQYAVDFATGGCIAYVDLETGDGAGYPIAALPGQMGADIPLTATAAGQVAARLAGDAMNVAHLIGGQIGNEIGVAAGATKGSYHPSLGSIGAAVGGPIGAAAGFGASLVPGLAGQVVNMLSRGAVSAPMLGGARGFASFGAPQTPYIQIRRGIYPDFGADIMGNATAGVYTVGDLSGFVSGEIKTDSLSCSDYEKSQIKQLISHGIYI